MAVTVKRVLVRGNPTPYGWVQAKFYEVMQRKGQMTGDQFMCALAVWREARGEPLLGKSAVYNVMLNRRDDPKKRWPNTLWEVVLQPKQFSSFNAGDPNATLFPKTPNDASWLECVSVTIDPSNWDATKGANHYHDISIAPPFKAWLGPTATLADLLAKKTLEIGRLRFYKL